MPEKSIEELVVNKKDFEKFQREIFNEMIENLKLSKHLANLHQKGQIIYEKDKVKIYDSFLINKYNKYLEKNKNRKKEI
ncbi:MAG: hypothetical protein P8X70_02830 [Nanoarchaeota archaeon]